MTLESGTKLGPYQIVSRIGAGGMGEVWKARDSRLDRDVAIKTCRAGFDGRFQKEARAIAALNHPNICTLYDVGTDHLVMEYIEGPTLADRIAQGSIPLKEALDIAAQIAAALDAAHEKAIVHRDLKPANIKLRPDGSVKVLDFGLARAGEPSPENSAESPTMLSVPTQAGVILGTAGYMSPEQARGQAVDKRADIWAFGVVLYEMLTGKRLFDGATVSDALAAILKTEPDLTTVPPQVRRLLASCLEKDPKQRLRDIGDWRTLLTLGSASATPPRRIILPWVIAVISFLLLAASLFYFRTQATPPAPEFRTEIVTPPTLEASALALSPDGHKIAYVAADGPLQRLWVRSLDSSNARALLGTEGAAAPFWSPDGLALGFWSASKIKRIELNGGAVQTIANSKSALGADWNAAGVILFSPNRTSSLFRVSAAGGEPAEVTKLARGNSTHRLPHFLPDGKRFLFFSSGAESGIYLGSLDGGEPKLLVASDSPGQYLPSGWLLWGQQNALVARHFDAAAGLLTGDPVTLAQPSERITAVSVSNSGLIAWRSGPGRDMESVWFNRSGQRGESLAQALNFPELSPNGRSVAGFRGNVGHEDIWLIQGGRSTRFTFDPLDDAFPLWSPDASQVVFRSNRKGRNDLYIKPADGAAPEQLLLESIEDKLPNSWSHDGKFILYARYGNGARRNGDLMILPLEGDRKPYAFLSTPFSEQSGAFSPDQKWVAYQSDESGRDEIYARPFPGPGGVWQISTGGGRWPRWRADGKELYYLSLDAPAALMAAAISVHGGSISPEQPALLFTVELIDEGARPQYDVSRDGRFLVNVGGKDLNTAPITLLQNWKPPK